jgi:hypothetical protein
MDAKNVPSFSTVCAHLLPHYPITAFVEQDQNFRIRRPPNGSVIVGSCDGTLAPHALLREH